MGLWEVWLQAWRHYSYWVQESGGCSGRDKEQERRLHPSSIWRTLSLSPNPSRYVHASSRLTVMADECDSFIRKRLTRRSLALALETEASLMSADRVMPQVAQQAQL